MTQIYDFQAYKELRTLYQDYRSHAKDIRAALRKNLSTVLIVDLAECKRHLKDIQDYINITEELQDGISEEE